MGLLLPFDQPSRKHMRMSDIRATRSVLQVHLSHILLFTFAIAIVLAIPIGVAVSRGTYTGLKPPMAVFFMFDALAKAFAICGLFALVRHLFNGVKYSAHPAEYLWILLGARVAVNLIAGFWNFAPGDILYLIGGLTAACLSRGTRWKCFYTLVALSPFVLSLPFDVIANAFPISKFNLIHLILAIKDLVISIALIGCVIGTEPTRSAWYSVVSQFSLSGVRVAGSLLIFYDLWQ